MIAITVPYSLLDSSTEIQQEANLALAKGATCKALNDAAIYSITPSKFPLQKAIGLTKIGCTVENFPLFIEVSAITDLVPIGLINDVTIDLDGVETRNTWEDWMLSNHTVMERDNRFFIGTNANNNKHIELTKLSSVFEKLVTPKDLPINNETL